MTSIVDGIAPPSVSTRPDWRRALPTLETGTAVLREVIATDAGPLAAALGSTKVLRYLTPGPVTPDHYMRFIRWVRHERRAGRYLCYGVVPHGEPAARGLFQLWPVIPGFGTAEMGFALDSALWGTHVFIDCATAIIDFAFDALSVRRLEFRSAVANSRGIGALLKLGAVHEGTLRRCFPCTSGVVDHSIWSILADEWRARIVREGQSAL